MDFIDTLLPIIIMLIWVVLTVSSNKKKKKIKSQEPSQRDNKTSHPTSFFDSFQKSVEDIFKENQLSLPFPVKTGNAANSEEKPVRSKNISQHEEVYENQPTQSINDTSERNMKSEKEEYPKFQRSSTRRTISVKRLREAIIWSEILAKPLSLRNDDSIE